MQIGTPKKLMPFTSLTCSLISGVISGLTPKAVIFKNSSFTGCTKINKKEGLDNNYNL